MIRIVRPYRAGVVLSGLLALVIADHCGYLLAASGTDLTTYDGARVTVVRVIDGDTIEVDAEDRRRGSPHTRVRLWGIDCPEPGRSGGPPEPFAYEATSRTRALVGGSRVTLSLEPHRARGTFGRVLAHVDLADGTDLAGVLLREGLAAADDHTPHTRLVPHAGAERKARRDGAGIWRPRSR